MEPGHEKEFLAPLPVGRLWGVGPKTEAALKRVGLERIGQIADLQHADLTARLGKTGAHLWQLAQGIDDRAVIQEEGFKSIGHEFTFDRDTADPKELHATLLTLSEKVAQRLRSNRARARTIAIKFRKEDFSTFTRRKTLTSTVNTAERIFPVARELMQGLWCEGMLVRLIGVYGSNLEIEASGAQMSLPDPTAQKNQKLASAMDSIVQRFGGQAITRAALVFEKEGVKRGFQISDFKFQTQASNLESGISAVDAIINVFAFGVIECSKWSCGLFCLDAFSCKLPSAVQMTTHTSRRGVKP